MYAITHVLFQDKKMPKASDVKKNNAIDYNGKTYIVRDIERSVPQGRAGGSIYRMRMYDVVTGSKIDETFKDSDMLNLADLVRKSAMFSYVDGDEYVFLDTVDYTPYNLNKDTIADEILFINEATEGVNVVVVNDLPVALDLPTSVELEVTETDPSIKGASATSRTKPALLSTGLTLQVPEHIANGDKIKVNVEERKFMGRADIKQ
ncbi:MAG: elongation factor P [Cellvibrionaceae bacterium]|jgi:elongation factor P